MAGKAKARLQSKYVRTYLSSTFPTASTALLCNSAASSASDLRLVLVVIFERVGVRVVQ